MNWAGKKRWKFDKRVKEELKEELGELSDV